MQQPADKGGGRAGCKSAWESQWDASKSTWENGNSGMAFLPTHKVVALEPGLLHQVPCVPQERVLGQGQDMHWDAAMRAELESNLVGQGGGEANAWVHIEGAEDERWEG